MIKLANELSTRMKYISLIVKNTTFRACSSYQVNRRLFNYQTNLVYSLAIISLFYEVRRATYIYNYIFRNQSHVRRKMVHLIGSIEYFASE